MSAQPALQRFHPAVRTWFHASFDEPTLAQQSGWPAIASGKSTLLLAPTGSGKTLAAFLWAVDRLMFSPEPAKMERCRVLYVSPLKALAVDVERNLRAPIKGITAQAGRLGIEHKVPEIAVRTGDTPQAERARMARDPPDILITTPESLYLMLTSSVREVLRSVDTVIIDEIHSMVASKRGTHLFLSLERLEALRDQRTPLQRVGLSATQRPLAEIARLLGGGAVDDGERWRPRPVEIVDAGSRKALELLVEVPVEDMSRLAETDDIRSGPASSAETHRSIWPSIHPRLVELIRAHRSTMIFVNSRRLSERLSAALNETAGEELALAHHGSVARERRMQIEDRLKRGELRAIVATSTMELGLDIGAVDLVIQIEAPPSVASGMQRIGRASHQVGATSRGVIFPKYRGDLLACAAATARMLEGRVEETYYPRNPLDVLAQQIVAIVSDDVMPADHVYDLVRRAAPYAELPRSSFESVLDMLSGRFPSDEFAELRPRLTWDRVAGTLRARPGARRIAVVNGGTIPDRGLFGVFLADGEGGSKRVGELDEEMVFESREGDVFLLGASSWRIEEITYDRVIVRPAPGQPGKMPFWHGDRPGRPLEFGRAIGELARTLAAMPTEKARKKLRDAHGLDERAVNNLLQYIREQAEATGEVPSDQTIVVERYVDEMGDWRVCLLSPFGARVHAPWATAVMARLKSGSHPTAEMIWSDDGMVFRLPESEQPPALEAFLPAADEVEDLIVHSLADTSLFASRFRENSARALLLPKRHPGQRSPLWAQRKRSSDLLAVASRHATFPIILETYRECLKDVFDLPGLVTLLRQIQTRQVRIHTVDSRKPSPFASALLFSWVANFIYDGDAPLAERRAQALAVDATLLRELLGEAELRELLDADALDELERQLQRLDGKYQARDADAVHDLLRTVGDLSADELRARCTSPAELPAWLELLQRERRAIAVTIAGQKRFAAAEDAARFRDALGVVPPRGLPRAFLEPVDDALGDLVSRYARTHAPFHVEDVARRLGLGVAAVHKALQRLADEERVLEGEYVPRGQGREWVDAEVLRTLKRRSLARLRREVEPVEQEALGRFLVEWQGVTRARAGFDAILNAVEVLQGAPIAASVLERDVLPLRVKGYQRPDLDVLCSAGEVIWRGLEPLAPSDGRIALYLADHYALLAPPPSDVEGELAKRVLQILSTRGASFFNDLQRETGAFPTDLVEALWDLVWAGLATNDTLAPLRSMLGGPAKSNHARGQVFRSRRLGPPGSEGRWALLPRVDGVTETQRRMALATQLLQRYGVLTREAVHAEGIAGGFSAVYDVLKAMEDAGKARRGYFVAGLGATQFALPGADDRLRAARDPSQEPLTLLLSSTDPANPYGAALPWPERDGARPQRAAGAHVVLHDGKLLAYIGKTERSVETFLPADDPQRSEAAERVVGALARLVDEGRRRALLIEQVDGQEPSRTVLAAALTSAGFRAGSKGFLKRAALHGGEPRHA